MANSPILGDLPSILKAWEGFEAATLIYFSSTEAARQQTDGHISGLTDYWTELMNLGQANAAMGGEVFQSAPYSNRLRLVSGSTNFADYGRVFLSRLEFRAYDTTLNDADGIAAGQNSSVLTAIDTSAGTVNDAYVQSRFRNGEVGGWQPNFFRPSFRAGGKTIFANLSSTGYTAEGGTANTGDLSIGLPLPYEYNPPLPISLGQIAKDTIEPFTIMAGCGQVIKTGGGNLIQRYAIQCVVEVLLAK